MRRVKTHTINKLKYFKKYLEAYLVATKRLPIKHYIDAFAGTGKCILCDESCKAKGGEKCLKCGRGEMVDGSALIAVKAKNSFSSYLLIELDEENYKILDNYIKKEATHRYDKVKLYAADSNDLLKNIHKYVHPRAGCLILLDPEGPELLWDTIKHLSKIKKAELFILFPYDMALARMVPDYKNRLDDFFGSKDWRDIYDSAKTPKKRKNRLLSHYLSNLNKLGFQHVSHKQIKTNLRDGRNLYHLIHTTHNSTAKKIIDHVFDKELDGQTKMKF